MQKLFRIVGLLLALTCVGVGWFFLVEGWSLVDAIYMTVITLSTVGFSEVRPPLEPRTKLFIAAYLVAGIGIFMYGAVQLGELLIRAELADWWRQRNMDIERQGLEQHYIICGCGRVGQRLCQELVEARVPFVVIDRAAEALEMCRQKNWPAIQGDASDDHTLLDAGLKRARGLAAVLSSDADNLFVVLSSKLLAREVRVIARAFDEKGAEKMQKAGADQVVSLYASGATRMAQLLINPSLGDFYEIAAAGGAKLDLAEINVTAESAFAGKKLFETDFRRQGVLVVGITKPNGKTLLPPPTDTLIEAGDSLYALVDRLTFERLAGANRTKIFRGVSSDDR